MTDVESMQMKDRVEEKDMVPLSEGCQLMVIKNIDSFLNDVIRIDDDTTINRFHREVFLFTAIP